jgi:hypothetical protein
MDQEKMNRVVAAALAAASVGAVAGGADEADAQSAPLVAPVLSGINWGAVSPVGDDWFAEYHQDGYQRELDQRGSASWANVFVQYKQLVRE